MTIDILFKLWLFTDLVPLPYVSFFILFFANWINEPLYISRIYFHYKYRRRFERVTVVVCLLFENKSIYWKKKISVHFAWFWKKTHFFLVKWKSFKVLILIFKISSQLKVILFVKKSNKKWIQLRSLWTFWWLV